MKRPGRRTKLLSQVGALVAVLFALAILVNGAALMFSTRVHYEKLRSDQSAQVLRMELENFQSMGWLVDYWVKNYESMDPEENVEERIRAIQNILTDYDLLDVWPVTEEQAAAFRPEEQRVFAEFCFWKTIPVLRVTASAFRLNSLTLAARPANGETLSIFDVYAEGGERPDSVSYGGLGQRWPFVPREHPAVMRLYESGEDVPAALFMMIAKTLIKNETMHGQSPGEILARVNTLQGADSADPARLLPYLRARIDAFTGGAEQFDDITMLGIRVNSRKGGEKERREGL